MRITFVLSGPGDKPAGGFKVVYEYANFLANCRHQICIVHAPYCLKGDDSLFSSIQRWGWYFYRKFLPNKTFKPISWFQTDSKVALKWIPCLHPRWVPDGDIVIATAWETAEWVAQYSSKKGVKYYLIQGNESHFQGVDPERVMATWKLHLYKIVISEWLNQIAESLGETATYITNGLDFDKFNLDNPIEKRSPFQIIMLYHKQELKGSKDGLEALQKVKKYCPQLTVTLFGVPKEPEGLPDWIRYFQNPHQALLRNLYNDAAIFVGSSWFEGWGLTPAEAAQCGAALCLTDIGGYREYALHGKTALLSPPKDPNRLAENILKLIQDQELRIQLATQGNQHIQSFTWEKSVKSFENLILQSQM